MYSNVSKYLEAHGWLRSVAGEADFTAAVNAICETIETHKGLIVSGEYGCGKTSLLNIVTRGYNVYKVRLGLPTDIERLTDKSMELFAENLYERNVFLDDLGAEKQTNEYGVLSEIVGDFICTFHELNEGQRLFITTNLNMAELDERYGGRVVSRLKDLCVPLKLNGTDKREWSIPNQINQQKGV